MATMLCGQNTPELAFSILTSITHSQKSGYDMKTMHALASPSTEMWWETSAGPVSWEMLSSITI